MKVKVFAKLNLCLNVYPRQGQFHPLDGIACTVSIWDEVTVVPRNDNAVAVSGMPNVPMQQNSAHKAAVAFCQQFGTKGVDVTIAKGIAMGAGLGGSSADAAAVVHCMCALFGVPKTHPDVRKVCASVGSDVYFMLFGGVCRMQGKGEDLQPLQAPQMHFVVVTFDQSAGTKQVFDALDNLACPTTLANVQQIAHLLGSGNVQQAQSLCSNSLQQALRSITNYDGDFLTCCQRNGYTPHLTGSGTAYFVVCQNAQQAQTVANNLARNGYNSRPCHSTTLGIEQLP